MTTWNILVAAFIVACLLLVIALSAFALNRERRQEPQVAMDTARIVTRRGERLVYQRRPNGIEPRMDTIRTRRRTPA